MSNHLYFLSPEEERRLIEATNRKEAELRAHRESVRLKPQVVQNVGQIARTYPNVPPGVALSLAKAGKTPNDAVVKHAARKAGPLKRGVKFLSRAAFTALETPLQEIQGGLRTLAHASDVASSGKDFFSPTRFAQGWDEADQMGQSSGILALKAAVDPDEKVRLGSGFFSGGAIRKKHEAAVQQHKFSGQAITTGRLIANVATQPGTKAYKTISGLIDAGVQIADPVGVGLGAASKVRKAGKLFSTTPVSLAPNLRKIGMAAGLVDGPRKTNLPEVTAKWLNDPKTQMTLKQLAVMKSADEIWKASGKNFDVKLATELADAESVDDVRRVLEPALGITVREKPTIKPIEGFRRRKESVRLLATMPGKHIEIDDLDDAVEQLDRLQKAAKLPLDKISKNNEALMRTTGSVEAANVIMQQTAEDIAAHIAERLASRTNFLAKGLKPGRKGFSEAQAIEKAKSLTRFFPDTADDLKRFYVDQLGENKKVLGAITNERGWVLPTPHAFVEYTRLIPLPDVQEIRAATSRFPNLFMNPQVQTTATAASWVTGSIWKPLVLLRGAYIVRVVGEEQARMAASGLQSLYNHPMSYIAYVLGRKGNLDELGNPLDDAPEFQKAMSGELDKMSPSGFQRADGKILYRPQDENYYTAWADEISKLASDPIHQRMATTPADEVKEWFFSGPGQKFRKDMAAAPGRETLLTREGADAYLDSVGERLADFTKGQEDLLEMIGKGRVPTKRQDYEGLVESLKAREGPDVVPGDKLDLLSKNSKMFQQLNRAVDFLTHATMEVPTNKLSRSVAFKQFYKQRFDELAESGAELTSEEMDVVAKGFALDKTKKLLYDMHEKGQAADIVRVIAPFAEAWKEVVTRWAKIGMENPSVVRRFQQGIEGARGSGVFYPDDSTGEEMFAYPGLGALTEALLGVPVRMEGRVSGLSIGGQVLPGLGPVAIFPVGKIIPDKPEWDSVREVLLPFGEPDLSGGVVEAHFPAYLKKFFTAMKADEFSDRVFANTVADVSNYLVANKGYTVDSPEAEARLLEDSKRKAKGLYLIRGLAQFVLPTGPQPKFLAKDASGQLHTATLLATELRKLYETEPTPEAAIGKFLDRFGEDSYLYLQPKSRDLIPGIPVTEEGTDWVRSNPDIVSKYPNVYGMFAPEGGEFDFEAYNRYLETGSKERILPRERFALGNHRIASMIYEEAKNKVGDSPSKSDAEWLRGIKELLMTEYPGYNMTKMESKNPQALVMELKSALKNPKLAKTDAGKGLELYMMARDKAVKEAKSMGRASFGTSEDTRHIRDWLRDVSLAIEEEHPGFSKLWDFALSKELKRDDPLPEEEAVG